ncbi:hypothetical protein GUJ93_ZPchr0006g41963 [Zizania palustris]|uniref:Uncharacterized protein n=1 Tax=Zizania palustris TaxID=103762 RepID=A0A8J5T296_ZIZPA|nr:hypothetical protein GUJ93_ZPchr0006g41963 [Zizania palustris]
MLHWNFMLPYLRKLDPASCYHARCGRRCSLAPSVSAHGDAVAAAAPLVGPIIEDAACSVDDRGVFALVAYTAGNSFSFASAPLAAHHGADPATVVISGSCIVKNLNGRLKRNCTRNINLFHQLLLLISILVSLKRLNSVQPVLPTVPWVL